MLAEVHYEVLADGTIKIVDLVGFMDMVDIKEKYGEEVCRIYFANTPNMNVDVRSVWGKRGVAIDKGYVFPGAHLKRNTFGEIVSEMKACGKRLSEIVKRVEEHEPVVKVVKI